MKSVRPLCLWVLLTACQGPPEPARQPAPLPAPRVDGAAERAAVRARRLPRTSHCEGLPSDTSVGEASFLRVPQDGRCRLIYPSGAVVTVHGETEALVAPDAQSALVLGVGLVEVDLPAGALTPESGFWIALPGAELQLVESGRLVARTFVSGASRVALVSGRATVRGEPDVQTLRPGQAATLATSGVLTPVKVAASTVEVAFEWARSAQAVAGDRSPDVARAETAFRSAETAFEAARGALEQLERQHGEAVSHGDRDAVRRLQADVAKQSAVLLSLRRARHGRAAAYLALRLPLDQSAHEPALAALRADE